VTLGLKFEWIDRCSYTQSLVNSKFDTRKYKIRVYFTINFTYLSIDFILTGQSGTQVYRPFCDFEYRIPAKSFFVGYLELVKILAVQKLLI